MRKEELVINDNETKILRAGFGNIIIPMLVVVLVLINQIMADLDTSIYIRLLISLIATVLFVKMYLSNISKISIDEDSVNFTTPLRVESISKNKIQKIYVFTIKPSLYVNLIIRTTDSILPTSYSFVTQYDFQNCVDWVSAINEQLTSKRK